MPTAKLIPPQNTPAGWHYDRIAIVLHWGVGALLAAAVGIGWTMMEIEDDPGSDWWFNLHKSIGIVIVLLVLTRLAWRLMHRPRPLPSSVPRWQARLAGLTQALLYAVMLLMPLTGYLGASYSKAGVAFFGWATPRWALADHDRAEWFFDIHSVLAWVLVGVVAAHALGALKHLLLDKDGVFQRMAFGPRS